MPELKVAIVEMSGSSAIETISKPGLCDVVINSTAREQCGVYQLKNSDGSPMESGEAQLMIVRGSEQTRNAIAAACYEAQTSLNPDMINSMLGELNLQEDEANNYQVICVSRAVDGTRTSVIQGGVKSELNVLQTEVDGEKGSYQLVTEKGGPLGVTEMAQGKVVSTVVVGGGAGYVNNLTGGGEVAIEGNSKKGWDAETAKDGMFPIVAQIALVDAGTQPTGVNVRDKMRKWVDEASGLTTNKVPMIMVRENNEVQQAA